MSAVTTWSGKIFSGLRAFFGWFKIGRMALLFLLLTFALILSLPPPNVLVSASLDSESVDVRVLNPDEMMLFLPRAMVDDGTTACRTDVTVRVDSGGRLAISRPTSGALHVVTSGPTQWSSADGTTGSNAEGVYITVEARDEDTGEAKTEGDCKWRGNLRLPLVGEMSAGMIGSGSTAGDEFLPLTGGELTVYGRAVDRVFGLPIKVPFFFLPVEPEKLYVASSFPVPPGSQIEGGSARFWGFFETEVKKGVGGLHIEASTNAGELSLLAPAPKVSADASAKRAASLEPDKVSLTFGARLAGDPNLHLVFWALSGLMTGLAFAVNLLKVTAPENKPAKGDATPARPARVKDDDDGGDE